MTWDEDGLQSTHIEPQDEAARCCIDWFNTRRLLEPIDNVPPAEAEARCLAQTQMQALVA